MDDPTQALGDRLFRDALGALELFTVYLGERLGFYRTLREGGPATSAELAARTGTAERYVREWLEHHAASGLLEIDDAATGQLQRRYRLPATHIPVLADQDDVRFAAYRAIEIVRAARRLTWSTHSPPAPPPRRYRGSPKAGPPTTAWST